MKMTLLKLDSGQLCWIEINKSEALSLIKSLINQIEGGPNNGRLETGCTKGDASHISIAVK